MKKLETWKFIIQVAFSAAVMSLCIYKLATADPKDNQNALYWGGLSGILGYWLPSPTSDKENDSLSVITASRAIGPSENTGFSNTETREQIVGINTKN